MSLQPGCLLKNRYVIIKELGRGRNITYLVKDTQADNKLKAIKEIEPAPDFSRGEMCFKIRKIFEKEVASLMRLGQHSQIPKLFDLFEENNKFYLVQEYIKGYNLSQKEIVAGNKLSESETIKLVKDICKILDFVHKNGLIHRDIKPSNLIRANNGKLFLIDFGSAKEINCLENEWRSTMICGTPGYIPREQINRDPKKCSDIYAVGIIAIQALTGYKVKEIYDRNGSDYLIWNYSLYGEEKLKVSPQLEFILNKMTCRQWQHRYQSAKAVLKDIEKYSLNSLPLKQHQEENIFIKLSAILILLLAGFVVGIFYASTNREVEIIQSLLIKSPLENQINDIV